MLGIVLLNLLINPVLLLLLLITIDESDTRGLLSVKKSPYELKLNNNKRICIFENNKITSSERTRNEKIKKAKNKPTTFKFSKFYNTRGYAYFIFEDVPHVQSQLEDIITNLCSVLFNFGKDLGFEEPSPDQYCLNGQIDDGRKIRINMIFMVLK